MFYSRIFTNIPFLLLSTLILLMNFDRYYIAGVNAASVNLENVQRQHRPLARLSARLPIHYGKIRTGLSDLIDDDDLFDLSKRQVTDDYGHLRFGKRGEDFDDYGHLRFGRSHGE